jgi:arginase
MSTQTQPTQPQSKTQIALIGASIGWGSALESAERGPKLLLDAGLGERVNAKKVVDVRVVHSMADSQLSKDEIEQTIMEHAGRVADEVHSAIQEGYFPVVIGGDHTSALGFYTGLARSHGELGIIWVDTHPDLHTPDTSQSGNIHGMPLAGLLGRGSDAMLSTTKECQTCDEHVAMVGIRDVDMAEQKWLDEGKIHCMRMEDVRSLGLATCMCNAVETANRARAGYGVTIDIDVLDPTEVPFVATPIDGGIYTSELAEVLTNLPCRNRLRGIEVIEFTPRDDGDAEAGCELISSLINAMTSMTAV